ncbi:MAG: GntR family transcriptional regulator [Halanaerobiales bacterium]|nr:GntR family transcriptional regulator [Halanaerobiales bacterium]
MAIDELTKKEQIINFAQSDPFLKISDIAEYVQTTPRYVRTILSEANISLMKLREKYARNMEKRLENDQYPELQAKVSLREEYSYNNLNSGNIEIEAADENLFPEIQRIRQDDQLVKIYQIQAVDDEAYCVHELITFLEEGLNQERMQNLESVYDLLGRKGIHHLQFMSNIITVESPTEIIRRFFNGADSLLVSHRTVLLNKIPIGMERIYLRSDLTKVEFAGEIVI